jgi:hypothetical protein
MNTTDQIRSTVFLIDPAVFPANYGIMSSARGATVQAAMIMRGSFSWMRGWWGRPRGRRSAHSPWLAWGEWLGGFDCGDLEFEGDFVAD